MSKDQIPLRELERLSAYIDGELRPAEARKLQARLDRDPVLQKAYRELRAVASSMRMLPQARPPRSFTLSPEHVGLPQRRSYPILRLATVVAAFAFVALVGVDAFTSNIGGALPSRAMEQLVAEAPALAESEALGAAKSEPAEPAAVLGEPTLGMLAGDEAPAAEAEGEALAPAPEKAAVEDAVVPEGEITVERERAVEAQPTSVEPPTPAEEQAFSMLSATEQASQDALTNQLEADEALDQPPTYAQPETSASRTGSWLRVVEIGLGALTLVLGALTLWARKRPR